jgi:hypothetical protein
MTSPGVASKSFSHLLEGQGFVFGVQFLPGGFCTFLGTPVASLTDRSIPIADVFGATDGQWEEKILALRTDAERVASAESFLRAKAPQRHAEADDVLRIVDAIAAAALK